MQAGPRRPHLQTDRQTHSQACSSQHTEDNITWQLDTEHLAQQQVDGEGRTSGQSGYKSPFVNPAAHVPQGYSSWVCMYVHIFPYSNESAKKTYRSPQHCNRLI